MQMVALLLRKEGFRMSGDYALDVVKAMIYKGDHSDEQKEALQIVVKAYEKQKEEAKAN